jgi:hypothetical protein
MKKDQIQQGDVLLERIAKLPVGCSVVPRQDGLLIIAKGEATGHHHVIVDKGARLLELKGELYLEVTEPAVISHDEHKPLPIPTGIYQVGRVKEHDYFQDMEHQVRD